MPFCTANYYIVNHARIGVNGVINIAKCRIIKKDSLFM